MMNMILFVVTQSKTAQQKYFETKAEQSLETFASAKSATENDAKPRATFNTKNVRIERRK